MKRCNKCGLELELSRFSKDGSKSDGLRTICRACVSARNARPEVKARNAEIQRQRRKDPKWAEYYKEYAKEWRKTPKGRVYEKVVSQQMKDRHPMKYIARKLVGTEVRQGRLVKFPCFVCGDTKVEAHHVDYDQPLSVIWLCNKHHNEVHHGP